jgi:hypothetical protein
MLKDQSILDFFTKNAQIGVWTFVINFLLAALLSFLLGRLYARFGSSLSNREAFGQNFVLITTTTMLIITIVKSSLALSLGLVGALSIVRFRAAIKEPEELAYLFLAVSIGLGFGAEQVQITMVAFLLFVGIVSLKYYVRGRTQQPNLYLTISSASPGKITLAQVTQTLHEHCASSALKRLDDTPTLLESSFFVSFDNLERLEKCTNSLRGLSENIKISYLDEKGIGS